MRDWRPQRFGRHSARRIDDPLIEPLWTGIRVLVHVDDGRVTLVDEDGGRPHIPAETTDALSRSILAREVILDGYMTTQAGSGIGVFSGAGLPDTTSGDVARQMFLGARKRHELPEIGDDATPIEEVEPGTDVVFVAVDLLMVDGEPLLDIPLLERKRLLDSVLDEGRFARLGMHVRPPIGPWLGTWKASGFRSLAWKHVNSRYRPGQTNDDWAISRIPER
jgi:ATP-dependent DNA ligase